MLLKLFTFVLGCLLVFSPLQELRASDNQEEFRGPRSGLKAPPSSMAPFEGDEMLKKLQELERSQKKAEASSKTKQSSSKSSREGAKKVKKNPATSSKASSSADKTSKKTDAARQAPRSRVPETKDVPLEEASSAPLTLPTSINETVIDPILPPSLPLMLPSTPQARREITTLDVATFMPSVPTKKSGAPSESEKALSSTPLKQKKNKKKSSTKTKEVATSSQASPSKGRIGKNYTANQIWDIMPSKHPQIIEESPLLKAKDVIAPKEIYPIHLLLAIAAGIREDIDRGPGGRSYRILKYNKVYIPDIRMVMGFKIMESGKLEDLKSKLLFDMFSKSDAAQQLLKLICIKGKEDFSKIEPSFMQRAQLVILSLTQEHWYKSGICLKRVDVEKRPGGNTLGEDYTSNFASYCLYEDGNLIENLQVRVAFQLKSNLN